MKTLLRLAVFAAPAVALLLSGSGCEVDPVDSPISVEPSSAVIHNGESVQFSASGGFDYVWTLSNTALGTLSNRTGPITTYTSLYDGTTTPAVQVLTCTSSIEGSTGSNSVNSVEVLINHL